MLKTVTDMISTLILNPLSLHDASKHHFASLKNDLIFLKPAGFRTKSFMELFQ